MSEQKLINLNRFHRLSLNCSDCDSYWQLPNYLVVLHGNIDQVLMKRLLDINFYLYQKLFELETTEYFPIEYDFEREIIEVFTSVKEKLKLKSKEIRILDIDVISSFEENMSAIIDFVIKMRESFDTMAIKVLNNSPKNFVTKFQFLKKNIIKSLESNNLKCAIDNLMDLNIAGFDVLVQSIGIIFNCFYILSIDICEPVQKIRGTIYCDDHGVVIERLANISAQNFLYKYKRRWLIFYREILSECRSLFKDNMKLYEELSTSGNYAAIEEAIYDVLILKNSNLCKEFTFLRHIERFPKSPKNIYDWWNGRSKEQIQNIFNHIDDCLSFDKKSLLFPFILTQKMPAKERNFCDIYNLLKIFDHINPELSTAISFIVRIYPEVFEQVYFPDREKYITLEAATTMTDELDNIGNKNTLRKCENVKCQQKNHGQNVIWNLNAFEVGKHSMNSVFKELIKNPRIFEEVFAYAQKNLDIAINADALTTKKKITKIVYR